MTLRQIEIPQTMELSEAQRAALLFFKQHAEMLQENDPTKRPPSLWEKLAVAGTQNNSPK